MAASHKGTVYLVTIPVTLGQEDGSAADLVRVLGNALMLEGYPVFGPIEVSKCVVPDHGESNVPGFLSRRIPGGGGPAGG